MKSGVGASLRVKYLLLLLLLFFINCNSLKAKKRDREDNQPDKWLKGQGEDYPY